MNANEQLFTELTLEEGAVIEGGAEFKVLRLESFVSGANHGWEDSLIIKVDNRNIWEGDMGTGEVAIVNSSRELSGGNATVQLINKDFIWGEEIINIKQPLADKNNPTGTLDFVGKGSHYQLTYEFIGL
ncbi:MAG: hypothetical protein QNJ55_17295 [Xenococcus sp. MO_188.B8]|nr:hypothetical protein [Xenococcus sp. MO_188.B8]